MFTFSRLSKIFKISFLLIIALSPLCGYSNDLADQSYNALPFSTSEHIVSSVVPIDGSDYWFVGNIDEVFYFMTNKNAANRRLIAFNTAGHSSQIECEIIPEGTSLLQQVVQIDDNFLTFHSGENSRLSLYDSQGKLLENIDLPTIDAFLQGNLQANNVQSFFQAKKTPHAGHGPSKLIPFIGDLIIYIYQQHVNN